MKIQRLDKNNRTSFGQIMICQGTKEQLSELDAQLLELAKRNKIRYYAKCLSTEERLFATGKDAISLMGYFKEAAKQKRVKGTSQETKTVRLEYYISLDDAKKYYADDVLRRLKAGLFNFADFTILQTKLESFLSKFLD